MFDRDFAKFLEVTRLGNMEIDLATLSIIRINDLRVLCKDRKISLGVSAKKENLNRALRA